MTKKKTKRAHDRVKHNATVISINQYTKQMDGHARALGEAIVTEDERRIDIIFDDIRSTREEAQREVKIVDQALLSESFFPLTRDTEDLNPQIVKRAMSAGLLNYDKHASELNPVIRDKENFQNLRSSTVQNDAFEIVNLTRKSILKLKDAKINLDNPNQMKDVPPIARNPVILQHIDRLLPGSLVSTKEDIAAFYSYLIINLDSRKGRPIDSISLSKSYLDYRAALLAIKIKQVQ